MGKKGSKTLKLWVKLIQDCFGSTFMHVHLRRKKKKKCRKAWWRCLGVKISFLTFCSHSPCLSLLSLSNCLPHLSLKLSFCHYADKLWQADLEAEDKSIHHLTAVSWGPLRVGVCAERRSAGVVPHSLLFPLFRPRSYIVAGLFLLFNEGVNENSINIYNDNEFNKEGAEDTGFIILVIVSAENLLWFAPVVAKQDLWNLILNL